MYIRSHCQALECLCILFLKWLRGDPIDIFWHHFPFWLSLHKFHQKSFVGGCVVTLYNTASGVLGHHLSFSEMNCKDSPQFSREKNQKNLILSQEPLELPVGLQFSPFDLNFVTLSHQFKLPHSSELAAADQKGLKLSVQAGCLQHRD